MKNLELYQKATYVLCKLIKKTYGVDAVPEYVINEAQVDGCTAYDGTPLFLMSTRYKDKYVSTAMTRTAVAKMKLSPKWRRVMKTDMGGNTYYYTYSYRLWENSPRRQCTVMSPTKMTKDELRASVEKENYYWFKLGTYTNRQYAANTMRRNVANL